MKKSYIYILLAFVCFFGFNVGVNGKEICSYEDTQKRSSTIDETITYTVYISYDANNSDPYEVGFKGTYYKQNSNDKNTNAIAGQFNFNMNPGKDNFSKCKDLTKCVYFQKKMNSSTCPKNVMINNQNFNQVCFYDDDSGKEWCQKKININNPVTIAGRSFISDSSSHSNLKDDSLCEQSLPIDGIKQEFGKITFKYDKKNDDLKVYLGENEIKDECFTFASSSSEDAHGRRIAGKTDKVCLANNDANIHSIDALAITRGEFNRKFLDYWNKANGKCPTLHIDPDGDSKGEVKTYWVLLDDAYEDVKENGSSKIDAGDFVDLNDWSYKWPDWFKKKYEYKSCDELIGPTLIEKINSVLLYIKILIPILLIGFGVADFIKAMVSTDEQAMSKAKGKFIKRLIVAGVIFLIPSITNLIFDMVNGVWAHINNGACNIWK